MVYFHRSTIRYHYMILVVADVFHHAHATIEGCTMYFLAAPRLRGIYTFIPKPGGFGQNEKGYVDENPQGRPNSRYSTNLDAKKKKKNPMSFV